MRAGAITPRYSWAFAPTGAVTWYPAEVHYQGCVPAAKTIPYRGDAIDRQVQLRLGTDKLAKQACTRVQACSRLP